MGFDELDCRVSTAAGGVNAWSPYRPVHGGSELAPQQSMGAQRFESDRQEGAGSIISMYGPLSTT